MTKFPTQLTTDTVDDINQKLNSQIASNYLRNQPKKKVSDESTNNVPILDLTSTADLTPQQQIANIEYVSTPQRASDIASMFRTSGNDIGQLVKTYGHCDLQQSMNLPSSNDMDQIYRDIYKINTDNSNTNQFLRLEELYAAITGSGIGGDTDDTSQSGLFTDIDESTMASLYEIVYGQPMNETDYYNYLLTGSPDMYRNQENGQLNNDTQDGSHLANFNELKPSVEDMEEVETPQSNDSDYRKKTGTGVSDNQVVNPRITTSAPAIGYNEITWELQLNMGKKMPVEAAAYFTGISFNHNRMLQFPKDDYRHIFHEFHKEHMPYRRKMSECSLQVLRNIIRHIDITYGQMPRGSLISLIDDTALKDDHIGIYDLVRKVLLDLYSLCYSFRHAFKDGKHSYLQYLNYKDLINLRINLNFLKEWSSHYWEYQDFIEVWESLDQAVGFMLPYITNMTKASDVRYGYEYFNPNQNNQDGVDIDTGNSYTNNR